MAKQLRKKFSDKQVRLLLERHLSKEIEINYILVIKPRRFFKLIKKYRKNTDNFSISYRRKISTRRISGEIEENIIKELSIENRLIENKDMPIKSYNLVHF